MTTESDLPETKTCCACGHEFPRAWYYARGGDRKGVVSECRRCWSKRRRLSREAKRRQVVDTVIRTAARSRPMRLEVTLRVATQRLGGSTRLGEQLADVFVDVAAHGSTAEKMRLFLALLRMTEMAEFGRPIREAVADEPAA